MTPLPTIVVTVLFAATILKGGNLEGTVSGEDGKPAAGVFVTARDTAKKIATSVMTDHQGRYLLPKLSSGVYAVRAHHIGLASDSRFVPMVKDLQRLDFVVKRVDPKIPSSSFLAQLPDGDKKRFLSVSCMGCHQFGEDWIRKEGKPMTQAEWGQSFEKMTGMFGPQSGFPIVPQIDDIDGMSGWLAQHLGKQPPVPAPLRPSSTSVRITEYDMPSRFELPHDLMLDGQGKVVITGMLTNTMLLLDPTTETIATLKIPEQGGGPRALEIDEEGIWWVLLGNARKIGRFDPVSGEWTMHAINEYPHSIGRDRNGALWFNGHFSKDPEVIGSLNRNGEISWFHTPVDSATLNTGGPIPYELRIAPDGSVWMGELIGNRIIRLDPETGHFKTWQMPVSYSGPRRFDFGPDGILWIPEYGGNHLTRFDPKTETFKRYPYPTSSALPYVARVNQLTNEVWIATAASDEVARFDPRSEKFDVFPLPSRNALIRHMDIDRNSGAVWVAYGPFPPVNPRVAKIEIVK